MLARHLRRWANIKTTLAELIVFAGLNQPIVLDGLIEY